MDKNKDRQVDRLSIFIASVIVIFVSITSAFINMTVAGTKRQVITTGNLQIEFEEGNTIALTNMMPMYDEVGIIQEPFDCKVINPTDRKMHYTLTLVDITKGNHLSNTAIRCGITKDGKSKFYDLQRVIEGTVDEGVILENQTINYQLRLWISDSVENNEAIVTKHLVIALP